MSLDASVPTQPDVTNRGLPAPLDPEADAGDLRRAEIETVLADGAWREGVEEWTQYTDLSAADVELAEALGLFRSLDFYWDDEADRLRYVVPAVPEDWGERAGSDGVSATTLQSELDDLGRTVAETVAIDYVDWGDGEPTDLVWGVETFGQVFTGARDEA